MSARTGTAHVVTTTRKYKDRVYRTHVQIAAVATAMQRLGFASLVASKPCRERDLVLAMVASRIVAPQTKLATTRWWDTTTLAGGFAVTGASEDGLDAAT